MAIQKDFLSFTMISSGSPQAQGLHVLYMRNGRADKTMATVAHDHDFWQLELMTAPGGRLELDDGDFTLRRGDVAVLPPGCMHRFSYQPGCAWLSIRYQVAWPTQRSWSIVSERQQPLLKQFRALLCGLDQADSQDPQQRAALHSGVRALLLHLHPRPQSTSVDPLVAAVYQHLQQQQGQYISVAALAEQLHYSKNYLSSTFRKRSGRALKDCIDQATASAAQHMLQFDDRSIGDIAAALGFNDIYAFSRFFLRMTEVRPSHYRKRLRHRL